MAKIWHKRIIAETQKFQDCPDRYRNDVLALLRLDVFNHAITEEKFTELTGEIY